MSRFRAQLLQQTRNIQQRLRQRRQVSFLALQRQSQQPFFSKLPPLFQIFRLGFYHALSFLAALPYFFFFHSMAGFQRFAPRDDRGNFLFSYTTYIRQRNFSLATIAISLFAVTIYLTSTVYLTLPKTSRGASTVTVCPTLVSGCDTTDIQAAINGASNGDIIQFMDGTYYLHSSHPNFKSKINLSATSPVVTLRGNVSVTQQKLDGTTTTGGVILDGFWAVGDRDGALITVANNSRIEGFEMTGGGDNDATSDIPANWEGGAIRSVSASPTIDTVLIRDAQIKGPRTDGDRYFGAGIFFSGGSPTVNNVEIRTSVIWDGGGGIFFDGKGDSGNLLTLTNSKIHDNRVGRNINDDWNHGGNLFIYQGRAEIVGNQFNGGLSQRRGGNIACKNCLHGTRFENNTIYDGTARWGGGMYFLNQSLTQQITMTNNRIFRNIATDASSGDGGGIYSFGNLNLLFANNTVSDNINQNSAGQGAANFSVLGTANTLTLTNNIFSNAVGAASVSLDPGLDFTNIDYNLYWNNPSGNFTNGLSLRPHDVASAPAFADTATGNYHLTTPSAAINAGTNLGAPSSDMDSGARPFGGQNDIGADEFIYALSDLYVDASSGSDATGDGSFTNPWKTITTALRFVRGGANEDTLHVTSGAASTEFNEQVTISSAHSGAQSSPTKLIAWTDQSRQRPIINANARSSGITINSANDIWIEGFTIRNASGDGIQVNNSSNVTVTAAHLYDHGGQGVNISGGSAVTVTNTVSRSNDQNGIQLLNSNTVTLINNTVHDNVQSGVAITNTPSVTIRNTLLTANQSFALLTDATSESTLASNFNDLMSPNQKVAQMGSHSYATLADWQAASAQDDRSVSVDPQYTNTYQLSEGSLVIDAGTTTGAPSSDIDGNLRPRGNNVDIGAFESGFTATANALYADAQNGNDSTGDGSLSAPYKTITKALAHVLSGTTQAIYLSGTFTEQVAIRADHSGSASVPLKITTAPQNASGSRAIITGSNLRTNAFTLTGASYVTFEALEIRDVTSSAIQLSGGRNITVTRSVIHDADIAAVLASESTDVTLTNNKIYDNGTSASASGHGGFVLTDHSKRGVIINNTLFDLRSSAGTAAGIVLTDTSDSSRIENNIIVNADRFYVTDTASLAASTIRANLLDQSHQGDVVKDGAVLTFETWQTSGQDNKSQKADPRFADITTDNIRLQNTSPALDAGFSEYAPLVDIENETRPFDSSGVDLGADEVRYPGVPNNVTSSEITDQTAKLSWAASYGSPTSFTLSYGTDAQGINLGTQQTTATPLALTSLQASTTYFWSIRATNGFGDSRQSGVQSFTTSSAEENAEGENPQEKIPDENEDEEDEPEIDADVSKPLILWPKYFNNTENRQPTIVGLTDSQATVKVVIDGIHYGTVTARKDKSGVGDFAYQPQIALLPNQHEVYVISQVRGEAEKRSDTVPFFVFSHKTSSYISTIARDYPKNPINVTGTSRPTFIGLVPGGSRVRVFVDAKEVDEFLSDGTTGQADDVAHTMKTDLSLGIHSVVLRAHDPQTDAFRMQSLRVAFNVMPKTPQPYFFGPRPDETTGSFPTFYGLAYEGLVVRLFIDNTLFAEIPLRDDGRPYTDTFEYKTFVRLSEGKHTVRSETYDRDRDKSSTPKEFTISVGGLSYTVKEGDTLWAIAQTFLGNGNRYPQIIEQNKMRYPSIATPPFLLRVGWILDIL